MGFRMRYIKYYFKKSSDFLGVLVIVLNIKNILMQMFLFVNSWWVGINCKLRVILRC